jgi:putative transposase
MAMILIKDGAWLEWRNVRWRFERRQDDITEWRSTDGLLRHTQFTDREIATAIGRNEMRLFDGHGRPPADAKHVSREHGDRGPSAADVIEAERKLEYVFEIHNRKLLTPKSRPDDWQEAIDHVWNDRGRHWVRLRGAAAGSPVKKPSLKSVRRWVQDAGPKPKQDRLVSNHRHKGNYTDRLDPAVRETIEKMIDSHWLARPAIRLDDLKTLVQVEIARINAQLSPGSVPFELPGESALLSSIAARPQDEVVRARYGDMAAFLKFGSAEAQADPEAPLDVVELDSTPADLFVICSRSGLPLGRPTIVICIDRCTRMVLGWFVTFEKPSVLSVMQTLRNAILPKDYIAEMNEHAGWNIRHECETYGVMRSLVLDRGMENLTSHVRELATRVGVNRVRALARKSPWLKGCVERTIRTMSERLLHPAKGTSLHNSLMRMDYKPMKDAVCTTDDLDWALHKYFVDVYPREPRRSLGNARAIDRWRSLTRIHPISFIETYEEVSHLFGRTDEAVPGRHGIKANSMSYFSRELLELQKHGPFIAALRKQGGKLTYHLDPADIGQIVVQLPHEPRHIVVPVAPKWTDYATGLSLFAHRKIRDYTTAQARDANSADELLECKHELLMIMRGSLGPRGKISERQLLTRMEGVSTMARYGSNIATTGSTPAPTLAPETTISTTGVNVIRLEKLRRNGAEQFTPSEKTEGSDIVVQHLPITSPPKHRVKKGYKG